MAEVPHDPSVTLRLELGRVTDQRDAYKAALTTEVLKVVRVAIIQATIDTDNQIAFLKAEVERLTKAGDGLFGIAYNAGPGEGRVQKLDAWRAAKEGKQP